jgi:phosphoribosylamine--glycine ligase
MRVLIIGSGGREHALAWKISREAGVSEILAAPGSAGISECAECVPVAADDVEGLCTLASERGVDLTVVGPEAPLAAGIADRFEREGLRIFGPNKAAAALEASKAFMKSVLVDAGVPTARHGVFTSTDAALGFAAELGHPVVVKADGLAAGKGVVVCETADQTRTAVESMLRERRFGEAGSKVVVEEFLAGEEVSLLALTDGHHVIPLQPAQDHKAVFDGDRGPNTGGMGAYSPAPVLDDAGVARIVESVLLPTLAALRKRGILFRGVLYAGLMITPRGPHVLEYNVRFGDPECQPLMLRLESSLVELIDACVDGKADRVRPTWRKEAAVCVVMSAEGYPGAYRKGDPIDGLAAAGALADTVVFHAGTVRDEQGRWLTAGGRVLGVTALGATIAAAAANAYRAVSCISWSGAHFRKDIAHRALADHRSTS